MQLDAFCLGLGVSKKMLVTPPAAKVRAATSDRPKPCRVKKPNAPPAATGPAAATAAAVVAAEPRALTKEEMDELKRKVNVRHSRAIRV